MRRHFHGFTLVELIVVIALMLIMISILLPAACMLVKAVHGLKPFHP